MSLFGKILVVLNLLGAAGLVYVSSLDYAMRQSWAHAYVRGELILRGLPLDEKELDSSFQAAVERLSEADYSEMFRTVGGRPVQTQMQEFNAVKQRVDERVAKAGEGINEEARRVGQTLVYARVLLSLTDAYLEREQMLTIRWYYNSMDSFQQLKARCAAAVKQALLPGPPDLPERPFYDAFRAAFNAQRGPSAEVFATLFLRNYPLNRQQAAQVNFEQAFAQAVEMQRAGLELRFKEAVDNALERSSDGESKKQAIAHFLYGVAPFLAEESLATEGANAEDLGMIGNLSPLSAEYHRVLVNTKTYRDQISRMLVVCGLRATLMAITQRTSDLRRMNEYAQNSAAQEQQRFVNDHNFVISVIREQAALVKGEQMLINENKERLVGYDVVAKERKAEIAQLTEDYKQLRASTAEEAAKLRQKSQEVLELRLRIRQAIEATERGEERIRALENRIRLLDQRLDD